MINNTMTDQKSDTKIPEKKPNEQAGIEIMTHVKIYDPNTGKVLVQKRGDT